MHPKYGFAGFTNLQGLGEEYASILQALNREHVELDVRNDIIDACDLVRQPFSFLRLKGFHSLAQCLMHATALDDTGPALRNVLNQQCGHILQLVLKTLRAPDVSQEQPLVGEQSDGRGVTLAEQAAALRVLQAVCLLHGPSREAAGQADTVQMVAGMLDTKFLVQEVLDALLALMANSPANQARFIHQDGIHMVCRALRAGNTAATVRRRCAEFLSLLASMVSEAAKGRQQKDEGGGAGQLEAEVVHALQDELGGDVAGVLLEGVDLDGSLDKDALEFHLQDLSAAAITHLMT